MLKENFPIPHNEIPRLFSLSELDLDYSEHTEDFNDLTSLAAKVAGTDISLINLIDSYTTWTISGHGLEIKQSPREESLCQYSIMGAPHFEIQNLSLDKRFKDKDFTKAPLSLRYYLGVPITDEEGHQLGALCVIDKHPKSMSPEKIEMLRIIADQVITRIRTYKKIQELQGRVKSADETKNKVAHDIRGPLAGIIGLSNIIAEQGDRNNMTDVLDCIQLIHKSSTSLLALADEILTEEQQNRKFAENEMNLDIFKSKLNDLYGAQAKNKNVHLDIQLKEGDSLSAFPKQKLLQITGNLISNAIKFSPEGGTVTVELGLTEKDGGKQLCLTVSDTGEGISDAALRHLETGDNSSTDGTNGEKGYGFGLPLVKHLVEKLGGTVKVDNIAESGACFQVKLPFQKHEK